MDHVVYRPPRILSPALQVSLAAASVLSVVFVVLAGIVGETDAAMESTASTDGGVVLVVAFGLIAFLFVASFVAGAILFPTYLYRAASNLRALGIPTQTTPAMAAGCWFIPCGNLVMPYQAIVEIERASRPEGYSFATSSVGFYWASWLAGNVLMRIGETVPVVGIFGAIAICVAGFLAIHIVRGIDANQALLVQRGNAESIAANFA